MHIIKHNDWTLYPEIQLREPNRFTPTKFNCTYFVGIKESNTYGHVFALFREVDNRIVQYFEFPTKPYLSRIGNWDNKLFLDKTINWYVTDFDAACLQLENILQGK